MNVDYGWEKDVEKKIGCDYIKKEEGMGKEGGMLHQDGRSVTPEYSNLKKCR